MKNTEVRSQKSEARSQEPNNPRPGTVRQHTSRRAILLMIGKRNNDGTFKNSRRTQIMMTVWNDQAIYFPRRKKLKGYQKDNS